LILVEKVPRSGTNLFDKSNGKSKTKENTTLLSNAHLKTALRATTYHQKKNVPE